MNRREPECGRIWRASDIWLQVSKTLTITHPQSGAGHEGGASWFLVQGYHFKKHRESRQAEYMSSVSGRIYSEMPHIAVQATPLHGTVAPTHTQ